MRETLLKMTVVDGFTIGLIVGIILEKLRLFDYIGRALERLLGLGD